MKSIIASLVATLMIVGSLQAQFNSNYKITTGLSHNIAPDLVVTSIKVPYVHPYARVYTNNLIRLRVDVTIKNKGNEVARNGFGIRTDLSMFGKKKAGETIARLQPGQSRTLKMTIYVPAKYNAKTISLVAQVDSRKMVRESNESNNYKKVRVKLPRYRILNRKNI